MSKPFERKDRFYHKAKKEGYPARSAYKILELDKRFRIFRPENTIVDLGSAPGGWLKVAEEKMKGQGISIGIDLLPLQFTLKKNTHFIQGDFLDEKNQNRIKELLKNSKEADWVLSDMSPNLSGVKFRDKYASFELVQKALSFALEILKPTGGFVFKIFPGPEWENFRKDLKTHFQEIKTVVPEATRKSSTEIYVICLYPRG